MLKKVAVIMGSDSDWDIVKKAVDCLKEYGIETEVHVMSAHRTPAEACAFAKEAKNNGFGVIIAAAGMAAHLGGVLAAHTTLPVIGLPIKSSFDGLDALAGDCPDALRNPSSHRCRQWRKKRRHFSSRNIGGQR